ncbi:MAG: YaiI/YqxD family protein [Pseudomonadaceae bacterium]|nr:YaiI/YqxD family protein [Pseudomonadaceae bacterium]
MRIWVDADACPNAVKEVIFKAADRREIETTLVANQLIRTAKSRWLRAVQVPSGFDAADDWIVEQMSAGDLVITADIPLANDVVVKGGVAINPRGTEYTKENIKDHLSRRDMMEELRSSGSISGGPPPFGKKEVQQFANAFDRQIARLS